MNDHENWRLEPWEEHNQTLASHAHPAEWKNPSPQGVYNLVALGGGTAGIIAALGAAGLGGTSALLEKRLLGGDCLNFGCVPSKALLTSAAALHNAQRVSQFGGRIEGSILADFPQVMARLRKLRSHISHHDSAQRFSSLGVDVYLGEARFISPNEVETAGQRLKFHSAVIASGGRPAIPEIPGLQESGCLTNETVFSLTELPARLIVIGGGPIGCELAQAFVRFGSKVTLINSGAQILAREEAEAAQIVQSSMEAEGVQFLQRSKVERVDQKNGSKVLLVDKQGERLEVVGDAVLVAVGRKPNVQGLGLEAAGVKTSPQGVETDDFLRTSNPRIFAAGDVAGRWQFTHAADAMARICVQNALFSGRARASQLLIPRTTYTFPELAQVGLTPQEAQAEGIRITTHRADLASVDRAILNGETHGFAKIYTKAGSGVVLGATVVGPHAGEMISEITLLMNLKAPLSKLAATIHCYPTQAEVLKRAADAYQKTRLTPFLAGLLKRWLAWGRKSVR